MSGSENMLIRRAMVGDLVVTAALDSCATNCFLSKRMSDTMKRHGYAPLQSSVRFNVEQGQPLCSTNVVHFLPVSLVSEEGNLVEWDFCLFVVADCGADIIIGFPTLAQGQIIRYDPPEGYVRQLQCATNTQTLESKTQLQTRAMQAATTLHSHEYGPPQRIVECLRTAGRIQPRASITAREERRQQRLDLEEETREGHCVVRSDASMQGWSSTVSFVEIGGAEATISQTTQLTPMPQSMASQLLELVEEGAIVSFTSYVDDDVITIQPPATNINHIERKEEQKEEGCKPPSNLGSQPPPPASTPPALKASALNTEGVQFKAKKKKGETNALTAAEPYGINPPLDDEVLEALGTLKLLSETLPETVWSTEQLKEIQIKLAQNRPEWADCLTLRHLEHTFDKIVAAEIEKMMDETYLHTVFGKSLKEPAKVNEFEINSKPGEDDWTPQKARRFKNPLMYDIIDAHLDWQLVDGLLSTSYAVRPAVITVVEKEGRAPRTCCDYRLRNSRTEVPTFPMPDIGDHIDESIGYKYYCSFDMAKMFNQIEIKKEHRDLAAFITHRGVHAPHRVQFGLAGGPQHAVREVGGLMAECPLTNGTDFTKWALRKNEKGENPPYDICKSTKIVKGSKLTPFIDDVFLRSNHAEGMIEQVRLLFEFCKKYHLLLSRKKANICKTHLKMLGMVVSQQGKHLDPSRIVNLLESALPRSKETLQSLLCSYNFIRQFIPNFSSVAAPLYEATQGIIWKGKGSGKSLGVHKVDPEFVWSVEMKRAYAQLRAALLSAPILVTPVWSLPLFLSVDASIRGEGWVLWQLLPTSAAGPKVAVAILYGSRKYTDTEAAWETTRQESNAIKDAITDVEQYIFGQKFYLFSDHLNLRWMHNSINRAVVRMRNFLTQFQMTVIHCPGIWNNADSHSRLESHIEAASNLNSATEANMSEGTGVGVKFSTGTDTSQDNVLEGTTRAVTTPTPQPHRECAGEKAKALRTATSRSCDCRWQNCAWCTDLPELLSDSDSEASDDEEERPFTNPKCFHTREQAIVSPVCEFMDAEWQPVVSQTMHAADSSVSPTVAVQEANIWNAMLNTRLANLSPCLTDTLPEFDAKDAEDLEWCEKLHRAAYAYRSATLPQKQKETRAVRFEGLEEKRRSSGVEVSSTTTNVEPKRRSREDRAKTRATRDEEGTAKSATEGVRPALPPVAPESPLPDPEQHPYPFPPPDVASAASSAACAVATAGGKSSQPSLQAIPIGLRGVANYRKPVQNTRESLAPLTREKSNVSTEIPLRLEPEIGPKRQNLGTESGLQPFNFDNEVASGTKRKALHESRAPEPCEVEEGTQGTQTSPADFRAAQVRIPTTEDFASVHGDLQGHHGLDYTYRKLFSQCGSKWANERGQATRVKEELKLWLQGCPACQKVKELKEKVKCKHSFIISRPFLEVSYDIIVFTSEDKHGNRYLVVAIDNFTKLVELKALRFKDAESVAQFLLELSARYGRVARLRSDRDPAFTGLIVTHLNQVRSVESVLCVAYHPQANSVCERQNAIIMQQLSAMCVSCALGKETKAAWSDLVPFIFSIVNNTPKSPLGISPLAMIYGVFANFERPLLPPAHSAGETSNPVDFVAELIEFQTKLLAAAESLQEAHLARYAAKYEKQRTEKRDELPRAFQQGDFVLLRKTAAGKTTKLTPKYVGPRLVLERADNDPTHPVLNLMDLTDMTVSQAAAEDCKIFNTDWFDEPTMMQELTKLAASDKEEFLVEAIRGHLPKGSKRAKPLNTYMFLVKWKDFPESENTWEPWSALKTLQPYEQYARDNTLLNLTPNSK
jgi:hypothetical protein